MSERLQFNAAFGLDEVFARQLRGYAIPTSSTYLNLARNRTATGNVIYSPSAYLLFSFEYRHLQSAQSSVPLGARMSLVLGQRTSFRKHHDRQRSDRTFAATVEVGVNEVIDRSPKTGGCRAF